MHQHQYSEKNLSLRYLTISSIFSFFLISLALISVKEVPTTGYEVSIYSSVSPIFWVATITGVLNGGLLFYYGYERSNKLWTLGLFQIIFCNFLIISLAALKGYFFLGRFDTLSYLAYAKDISLLGNIPSYNFYPIASLFLSSVSTMSGLSIIQVARFVPATFFILYVISILVWSRSISADKKFVTSMMFASLPIFYAWFIPSLYHETLCVLFLPFFLYVWWKGRNGDMRFRSISYLLIVFITLFHPLITVAVLIFLVIVAIVEAYTKAKDRISSVPLIIFALVAFLSWVVYQFTLVRDMREIVSQMLSIGQGQTAFSAAEGIASRVGIFTTIQELLFSTFDDVIFCLLALCAGVIILRSGRWKTHPMRIAMACFIGGMVALAVIMFTSSAHNPIRLINVNFNMVFTIPLVGYLVYSLRKGRRKWQLRIVTVLILCAFVTSIFSLNLSPITINSNDMITRAEASGMNWFTSEKDMAKDTFFIQTDPARFADLAKGHYAASTGAIESLGKEIDAPPHFSALVDSGNYSIEIANKAFVPVYAVGVIGATVTWYNNDTVTHTVTSIDGSDGTFPSSGNIAPGHTYSVKFNKTGTFNYRCSIYPEMQGQIVIYQRAGNYVVYSDYDIMTYTEVWGSIDRFSSSDFYGNTSIDRSLSVNKMYDNGNLRLYICN